tara:strand:- start:781 stop:1203 length:423 start_codon:yes stop_codon:yes gene_type:complete
MSWKNILKSLEEQIKQEVKKLEANKVFDIEYVRKSEIPDWNATYFDFKMTFDISEYKYDLDSYSFPSNNITWDLSILIYDGLHTNLQIHGGRDLGVVVEPVFLTHYNIRFKGDNAIKKLFEHLGEHLLDMYLELREIFVK